MTHSQPFKYKRLLVKLSGEALMGTQSYGIDTHVVDRLARDVSEVVQAGAQIAVVVGGGNIYRGLSGAAKGMDRATGDYMGMLATVMNALAFQNALSRIGRDARVMSAIPMPTVCESYVRPKALHHMERGRVVIFAAGTGNPFFTTDTAATLRAIEMDCEAVAKATQVDGVYSADPKKDPNAVRFDHLTHADVLSRDLQVMDGAAIALARDNRLPIIVFSISEPGNLLKVMTGEARATVISGQA
jgi:uridylate kinase